MAKTAQAIVDTKDGTLSPGGTNVYLTVHENQTNYVHDTIDYLRVGQILADAESAWNDYPVVGDYCIWAIGLFFDTTVIPSDYGEILSMTLSLYLAHDQSEDDFDIVIV